MGDTPRRPAGAADEPGAAQARRHAQPHRHDLHLHQPAAREDRRHVRQPGDDAGRPGAEVLRVRAARHPPHRDAQGGRRGDSATACASRSSRTRSRRRSSRPSSTSSTARASPGRARCSTSALERKVVQKSGSYFSFGDERLGQGRQNATAFLREHPDVGQQILARIQARGRRRSRSSRRGCCPSAEPADGEVATPEKAAAERRPRDVSRSRVSTPRLSARAKRRRRSASCRLAEEPATGRGARGARRRCAGRGATLSRRASSRAAGSTQRRRGRRGRASEALEHARARRPRRRRAVRRASRARVLAERG